MRDASPIDEIIRESGIALLPDGRGYKALCPFHNEKTPSFKVDPEKGSFHCYGCEEHGDVFSFVEKIDQLDFRGALAFLAQRAGIELTGRRSGPSPRPAEREEDLRLLAFAARWFEMERRGRSGSPAREYLARRGFRDGTLDAFGIGWAPPGWSHLADVIRGKSLDIERAVRIGLLKRSAEGRVYDAFRQRVVFPIRDSRGRVIGFGGRHLEGAGGPGGGADERRGDPPPKYINSPESELFRKGEVLYGHYEGRDAIRSERHLLLMEGYTDVMMAHQAGFPAAVATLGTALTEANVDRLARFADRVTLVFDGDRAGIEAARKAVHLLAPKSVETRVALIEGGEDPCDLLARPEGPERFRGLAERGMEGVDFALERCLEGEDPTSAGGRDRAARAFAAYVEKLPSAILRGTALERLAGRLALPFSRVERDFHGARRPAGRGPARRPPAVGAPQRETQADVGRQEEEGLLLAALAGPDEARVAFRLRAPEQFRDPRLGRIAAHIAAEGVGFDPLAFDAQQDKAKALELSERRERRQAHGTEREDALRTLVEHVRIRLKSLGEGPYVGPGDESEGWTRRVLEIRRAAAELTRRPPHEPLALVELLDRFGV